MQTDHENMFIDIHVKFNFIILCGYIEIGTFIFIYCTLRYRLSVNINIKRILKILPVCSSKQYYRAD